MALINYPPISEDTLFVTTLHRVSFIKAGVLTNTATILKAGNVSCFYECESEKYLKIAFSNEGDRDEFYRNFGEYFHVNMSMKGNFNYFAEKE